jgi:hypothetical protein
LRETRIAVLKEFLEGSLAAFATDEGMAIALFTLADSESLPPILTALKGISAGIVAEVIFAIVEKVDSNF